MAGWQDVLRGNDTGRDPLTGAPPGMQAYNARDLGMGNWDMVVYRRPDQVPSGVQPIQQSTSQGSDENRRQMDEITRRFAGMSGGQYGTGAQSGYMQAQPSTPGPEWGDMTNQANPQRYFERARASAGYGTQTVPGSVMIGEDTPPIRDPGRSTEPWYGIEPWQRGGGGRWTGSQITPQPGGQFGGQYDQYRYGGPTMVRDPYTGRMGNMTPEQIRDWYAMTGSLPGGQAGLAGRAANLQEWQAEQEQRYREAMMAANPANYAVTAAMQGQAPWQQGMQRGVQQPFLDGSRGRPFQQPGYGTQTQPSGMRAQSTGQPSYAAPAPRQVGPQMYDRMRPDERQAFGSAVRASGRSVEDYEDELKRMRPNQSRAAMARFV